MAFRRNHNWLLAASALSFGTMATPVLAQATAPQAAAESAGIEEIVVTAQRRSENVLNVPTSIQATTGLQLQTTGIKMLTDLQFITPGYNVSSSNGYTQIFIRGVGNALFVGADPSVATFIDDVPRIFGTMVDNFVDVERVEVLKGAQGGLYGRNATGGVVNIITKQPSTEEAKGDFRISYGTKKTFQASGYLNVPISEKLAWSAAVERRSRSAYIKNDALKNPYQASYFPGPTSLGTPAQTAAILNSGVNNKDVGNEDFWAVSTKILIKPSERFKITFAGDFSNKNDSNGNHTFEITPAYEQAVLAGTLAAFGIPSNLPPGFIQGNPKKFHISNGDPGFVRLKDYGVSATAVWELPTFDLTSISAYRQQKTFFLSDLGAASVPLTNAFVRTRKHFYYQEVRAISTFEGPLHLIGGATYLKDYARFATDVNVLTPVIGFPVAAATIRVKNYSFYGQAAYDFTDHITLTASARYIHEKNNYVSGFSGATFRQTEHKILPSANLSYKLDGGGNVYVRWARGFKSGGINPVADITAFPNPSADGGVIKGETIDTYEAGYRGTFLDRKLQLTAAVFYNDYRDIQTAAHANAANANTIILALINAGSARTYGIEGTLTWRVIPALTLGLNAGYLNAKYKDFKLLSSAVLDPFDLSGTRMTNSPEFQGSVSANLDTPMNDDFRIVGNVLVQRTSSVLYQVSGFPGVLPPAVGPAYWLTNARIGIRTTDDKYGLSIYANNLFNNAYVTFGNSNAGNATQLNWGNPRIVGVELSAKF
jgi:iron complex outermembrane recepter protein